MLLIVREEGKEAFRCRGREGKVHSFELSSFFGKRTFEQSGERFRGSMAVRSNKSQFSSIHSITSSSEMMLMPQHALLIR